MVQLMLQIPLEHLGSQQGLSKDNIACVFRCVHRKSQLTGATEDHSQSSSARLTYQREYRSKQISTTWLWEKSTNFTELRIFSFPPMSFSDFCLLFALLRLRKVFVEIFAILSGTLLILAVGSFPPWVLPTHVHHNALQLKCSCIIPC